VETIADTSAKPWRLVALSFLMLFVELGLIRWLGANVVYLSYFTNFVLLGSFLGIGLGFLAGKRASLFGWTPGLILGLVCAILVFPVEVDRVGSDVVYFGGLHVSGLPLWVVLPLVFLAVAAILFTISQEVAREFSRFEPLTAYRFDIIGSLLGIVGFTLLSWAGIPPVAWGIVVAIMVARLMPSKLDGRQAVLLVGLVVVLGGQSLNPNLFWTPYYRVQTVDGSGITEVSVNGIPHQTITSIDRRRQDEPLYFTPYQIAGETPERVLIIGAGTGTDVAIALDQGASSVDAVEIDPGLYGLGEARHPNAPYADERVAVHIDDGRAFMERSAAEYDLVLFALPDSLTLVSGQSGLRLESFLFTQQAIDTAAGLLDEDGTFAMYNYYRQDWLVDRLANTVSGPFGDDICVVAPEGGAGMAVVAGGGGAASNCPADARDLSAAPEPVSDDYPFLYIRHPGIPAMYLAAMASILLVSILLLRIVGVRGSAVRSNLDLFLMGAAFLLLETKSVVQFALWFGTTWVVNSLVFLAVLASVLAAIEVAQRVKLPKPAVLYGVLVVSIGASWTIRPSLLLELGGTWRFLAAAILTFTPIFVANLVFAQRFADTEDSTGAFGANLLGAMVGGVLEYASLILGYRSLAIIVGLLYIGAYFAWRWIGLRPPEPKAAAVGRT